MEALFRNLKRVVDSEKRIRVHALKNTAYVRLEGTDMAEQTSKYLNTFVYSQLEIISV